MAFSVSKGRPFRSIFYKSSGKHAAPKGFVRGSRTAADSVPQSYHPAHAATMPRLSDSNADDTQQQAA